MPSNKKAIHRYWNTPPRPEEALFEGELVAVCRLPSCSFNVPTITPWEFQLLEARYITFAAEFRSPRTFADYVLFVRIHMKIQYTSYSWLIPFRICA